ncbi:MAG: hypothetical protein M1816_000999 [Peltula sp. TS41687]|nr:MAG: hypothetical protein M1816_000999 [Peltula sp. TS41687]
MLPVENPSTLPAGLTEHEAGTSLGVDASVTDAKSTTVQAGSTTFPPPKTDKPRPHVCGTCSRSFARLEHLKRHERSHTKEKPFACPECTRCFARRDLLLRHQQKLHQSGPASARPRGGRRESASSAAGAASGRVRKNSVAIAATGSSAGDAVASSMRPRANTISHVDGKALASVPRKPASAGSRHGHHASLSQLPGEADLKIRGASPVVGHHGHPHNGLPRLETRGLVGGDMAGGLRTAPPLGGFPSHFEMDGLYSGDAGSTINPAHLHLSESPQSYGTDGTPTSPYPSTYSGVHTSQSTTEQEDAFHWINSFAFDGHVPFSNAPEYAVGESSPSALSTPSQSAMSDLMLDGSSFLTSGDMTQWPQGSIIPPSQLIPSTFSMDLPNSNFADLIPPIPPPGTVSPKSLHEQFGPHDPYFLGPPPVTVLGSHTVIGDPTSQLFHPPMVFNPGSRSASSDLLNGTGRPIAVVSTCTEAISETTRQALIADFSQTSLLRESPLGDSDESIADWLMGSS